MTPYYQVALFGFAILFLGFMIAMGTIMTTNLSAFVKRPMMTMLVLMLICLIGLVNRVEAMKGVEILLEKDLALGRSYEIIDQPIRYPDSTLLVALQEYDGTIKLYNLKELPPFRKFYRFGTDNPIKGVIYREWDRD